jgi:hypothetical protein
MKIKTVVSCGCSLLSGAELTDTSKVFTRIIAKHYDADFIDLALPGIGNEAISLRTTNHILENLSSKDIDPETTLVLINWTMVNRLVFFHSESRGWYTLREERMKDGTKKKNPEFFQNKENFQGINLYYENHIDEFYLLYYLINIIHKTKTFLEHKGFDKYVFSFANNGTRKLIMRAKEYFNLYNQDVYNGEGFSKFDSIIRDLDYTKFFDVAFLNFAQKEKYERGIGGHPLEQAHIDYSKILLEFIKKKYEN